MTAPHQLFPDLCDPTVRNRFYGGRDPEAVAAELPVLPVDAPGLPPPGPSFLAFARALGDPPPPAAVRGRPKPRPTGAYLTALVRNVLYQCGTVLQVDNAGSPLDVVPLPGALCTAHKGFAYGPGPCRLLVLGKCIGVTEAQNSKPYCGRGSEPLWDAWDEVGLPRPGPALPTFLTNLVPFAPPHTVKTLPREWVQDGLHLFYQQFAACRPAHVLVLGADALKALYGNRAKIEDYRGRASKLAVDCRPTADYPEDVHEAVVTVADHPAAVSRDPDKYPQFRSAMQFAAVRLGAAAEAARIPLDHAPVYTLDDLRREVSVSVAASAGGGYVAFDAEWEGRDFTHPDSYVYTVQWSHAPGHARCAFLRRCGGVENPDMPRAAVAAELNRLLAAAPARGARLVGHFAKADLPWLKEKVGVDLYPHYVGAADDPDPDGRTALYGWQKCYFEGAFDTYVGAHAVSECFPAATVVTTSTGPRRIGDIVNSGRPVTVLSRDFDAGELVYRPVTSFVKKEPAHPVVTVNHQFGYFSCTSNHRIWTENRGYVAAGDLTANDSLCVVQGAVPETEVTEQQGAVLRPLVFRKVATDPAGDTRETVRPGGDCQNGGKKSGPPVGTVRQAARTDTQGGAGEDTSHESTERYAEPPSLGTGRCRAPQSTRGEAARGSRCGLGAGHRCSDGSRRTRASGVLQDRCGQSRPHGRRGARRTEPQCPEGAAARPPTEQVYESSRVVGVTVPERGLRSLSGAGGGGDTHVYCIEVQQTHNFFADGVLVSNCQPLKLEVLASARLGIDRYDTEVIAWKERYCKANKISAAKLLGYGNIDEHIIYPYGCFDADAAGRMYLYLNGDPRKDTRGALDCDEYRNSSREIFAIRMRAWAAAAEIEYEGLEVDPDRHRELRDILVTKRDELIDRLRTEANWHGDPTADPPVPAFDPARRTHRIDFLFGEEFQDDGKPKRPPGALSLYLPPHKATASGDGRLWADACARAARAGLPRPAPAADKETLIVLSRRHAMVALLKDIDFVATALKGLLRPPIEGPAADEGADENDPDARVEEVFERGFMYHRCYDGRVRTMLALVETGRYSSKKPNLQNLSDAVNDQFNRILGWAKYAPKGTPERDKKFVSRSVVTSRRGWRVVTADLMGAEIAIAAWFSGDPLLIEVARRSTLKESDPDYLDQHADLAKRSFGLECSLAEVKENYKHLRTAAKRARFGHYYGASPETILRKAQEDSDTVTLEQIVAIVRGHDEAHPVLANFFAAARAQVSKPGHMCNGFGGRRRFRPSRERDLLAGQEREAQNWTCQGFVADAISYALGELWTELRRRGMRSRIILTVHDSIMVECPPEEVAIVHDELLPLCMTQRTAIVPTDLNGNPIPGRGPYHFGIDREVCERWGEPIEEEVWRAEVAAATAAV